MKTKINVRILEKIRKDVGSVSLNLVYKWVSGAVKITPEMGRRLEEATGVDRRKFCWPEEFGSPWPDVLFIYTNKLSKLKDDEK